MNRFTPASLEAFTSGRKAVEVDRLAEVRIEIERRIVRDAGKVDHRIAAFERPGHVGRVAQVALYLAQPRVVAEIGEDVVAVEIEVEHRRLVAGGKSASGRDSNRHNRRRRSPSRV